MGSGSGTDGRWHPLYTDGNILRWNLIEKKERKETGMGRIFDMDSPVMRFLTVMADLMILNILTIICCIPIITAGASLTGLHYVLLKMARNEEGYIVKSFFKRNENPCTCPPDFPVCVCGNKPKGKAVTRKPILPGEDELAENKRSKSAKLRVFERS